MKHLAMLLSLLAMTVGQSALVRADDVSKLPKVVSEAAVRWLSDMTYAELLRQATSKGGNYTPAQIESGYRRHYEEFKLQLIDHGYTILSVDVEAKACAD